ncbi:hypothetical protein N7522_001936 [Penicillium canescens]|nr:hypothetical protein N7522_001936 [Penicillium canescens]
MYRFFYSPANSRETVLFGGPDPDESNMHEPTKGTKPMMLKEQPAISVPPDIGLFAKDSAAIRLHTVRIWFHPNGLELMEDIKRKGLKDVIFDAIALQKLEAQHQAHDGHGITKEVYLVDLAVLEAGIPRVLEKYEITNFVPLSSDDPIILQQPAEDLDSKKALCYQHLHSKYLQEYAKRINLANVLGYEIHNVLKDWYEKRLADICNRLKKLGYY